MGTFLRAGRQCVVALSLTALIVGAMSSTRWSTPSGRTSAPGVSKATVQAKQGAFRAFSRLPLSFVPNAGQASSRISYLAQGAGFGVGFSRDGAMLAFWQKQQGVALALQFLGANSNGSPVGMRRLPGKVSYLLGTDRASWQRGLPTYGGVVYRDIWPGVNAAFKGTAGRLEYEFRLRPGASVAQIGLAYRGAQAVSLDRRGNLRLRTSLGLLTDTRPVSYQVSGGRRLRVESRFVLRKSGGYGFAVKGYDPRLPLVIDPGLVYSTFLGGSGTDQGLGIAVDATGAAYVTGLTGSTNFPTTVGAFDTSYDGGSSDAFVTKLNAAGTGLVYSTFLGGSGTDEGHAIAVDSSGAAYVTGLTTSSNFPTAAALPPPSVASDTSYNGSQDAFVTKLNALGTGLSYSTYLGGTNDDQGLGIAVNTNGEAYVIGLTDSTQSSFPFTPAAYDKTANGNRDVFFTVVNRFGTGNAYSTFLGGSNEDDGFGIAIDAAGDAFLTGLTVSSNFPTTASSFDTTYNGGVGDAFVTRFNFTGSGVGGDVFALAYSSFLGGGGDDRGSGIAVDPATNAYVTGRTQGGLPTTAGAFDTSVNGSLDVFVTKFNPAGSAPLLYSTYLGGSGNDQGRSIALDAAGDAYVTGRTGSTNFPTTPGSADTSFNGVNDAFVTKFNPAATSLLYSTYLGGTSDDQGFGLALDASGAAYATGFTASSDFPTTTGAYDTSYDGGASDAFVTKLLPVGTPATLTLAPPTATNTVGTQHCVTATVKDAAGNPVPGVAVQFSVPTYVATHASPSSGSATTDNNGEAVFCYSASLPGEDTIKAYADTNGNSMQDAGEPIAVATKTWTVPASTAFCEVAITNGGWIIATNGDQASFGGDAKVSADGTSIQGQEQYQDHGPVQPFNMHSINLTATTCSSDLKQATIFGTATIDGSGNYVFRIDVTDNGQSGANDSYGLILSNGYASGQQTLQGGNVTIHKS